MLISRFIKRIYILASFAVLQLVPVVVMATSAQSPLKFNTLYSLLDAILQAIILLIFPIVVLLLVYTGFLFVVAQGNASKIEAAKKALLWTIVGALVVLGAKALSLAIEATVREIETGSTLPAAPSKSHFV